MTQDEVNELVSKRDDAARTMLAALKRARVYLALACEDNEADHVLADYDAVRAAIAQAEAAGIKEG